MELVGESGFFFFFKQKTAYEITYGDWSSDVCSSDLACKTAKDRGRGRVEVYQDTDQSMVRRHDEIGLIGSVREALRLERIVVYAQPITPLINHSLPITYELLV